MAAATVTLIRPGRKGRQPAIVEELRDVRDELTAHCEEAIAFVDAAWPHVSALERMAIELGPVALKHALSLGGLLAGYERRHLPVDDTAEAAA
jgi:hypothetical protein